MIDFFKLAKTDQKEFEILNDKRRLTVAITRAKQKLIMIGSIKCLEKYKPLAKLIAILKEKDIIVNKIEKYKKIIPVNKAIKIFNISRATYQNYKTIVLNKCDSSYFMWCVKNYPQQLLKKEIPKFFDFLTKISIFQHNY